MNKSGKEKELDAKPKFRKSTKEKKPMATKKSPKSTQKIKKTSNSGFKSKEKGTKTVDNRNLKRKSKFIEELEISFKQIDTNKIDETVDTLFSKFAIYYEYTNTFFLDNKENTLPEDKELDFDLKLQTIFNMFKIKKANDSNLISNSEEGSYLLKHAKLWIIYIKILSEKYIIRNKNIISSLLILLYLRRSRINIIIN